MTRLAVCRKCRGIFFTNIRGNYRLRCPQRDCRSYDIMAWSARLLNQLGIEALKDLLPETGRKKDRKTGRKKRPGPRLPVEPEESTFSYCYHADFCKDSKKNLSEGKNCSNQDRRMCQDKARRRRGGLLPDEESQ